MNPNHRSESRSQRVRLGLLNASTARVYNLGFADDRPFELIGTDGGLQAPHRTTRVPLSPGGAGLGRRSVPAGRAGVLRSFPPDLGLGSLQGRFAGATVRRR
jgi:blue copper oxidase